MESGQDIEGGTPLGAPSGPTTTGRGTRDERTTEQVKLRLSPQVALRLRADADASGRTLSEYVSSLVDGRASTGTAGVGESRGEALATVSRLANATYQLAENLRLSRADLGRALGLVKHLFTAAPAAAEAHHVELASAARDLRQTIAQSDAAIVTLANAIPGLRGEMDAAARRLARLG